MWGQSFVLSILYLPLNIMFECVYVPTPKMFPSKPKFLQATDEEETKDPYRYLFLDFHPNSPEFARVRGNISHTTYSKTLVVSISQKTCKSRRILQSHLCV